MIRYRDITIFQRYFEKHTILAKRYIVKRYSEGWLGTTDRKRGKLLSNSYPLCYQNPTFFGLNTTKVFCRQEWRSCYQNLTSLISAITKQFADRKGGNCYQNPPSLISTPQKYFSDRKKGKLPPKLPPSFISTIHNVQIVI